MRTGCGFGAAAATLGDGTAGVTVGDGVVVGSRRGIGGSSTGGVDGSRGSTEGARVGAESVGVAIDMAKISTMSWIACKFSFPVLEKLVLGEVVVSVTLRAWAAAIDWSVEEACGTGRW